MPRANAQFYFAFWFAAFSLSFSFIMSTKPRGPVWDHFIVLGDGKRALTSKVRCKYCTWEHLGHPAKMQKHLDNRCPGNKKPEVQAVVGSSSSSSSSSSLFFPSKSESPSLWKKATFPLIKCFYPWINLCLCVLRRSVFPVSYFVLLGFGHCACLLVAVILVFLFYQLRHFEQNCKWEQG